MRNFDWRAWRDGNEEFGPFGWGTTEQEAIDELRETEADEADDTSVFS